MPPMMLSSPPVPSTDVATTVTATLSTPCISLFVDLSCPLNLGSYAAPSGPSHPTSLVLLPNQNFTIIPSSDLGNSSTYYLDPPPHHPIQPQHHSTFRTYNMTTQSINQIYKPK